MGLNEEVQRHVRNAYLKTGVDLFLTNDRKLQKLPIPGIQFIRGLDSKVL